MKSFLIFILIIFSLQAFTPGKWSPLDKYVMGLDSFGPISEEVKTKDGKILYKAEYEYDDKGRLIKEKFKKGEGTGDGETVYTYEKNKLSFEELYSTKGLEERKVFKYTPNGELKEITVFNTEGKETMKYKILSMWRGMASDGEIKWLEDKEVEIFNLKKDLYNEKLYNQEIFDEKRKTVAVIRYYFDENGKIIKRENIQAESKRMSEIKYDESNRVTEISFSIFKDNDWVLLKTHSYKYNGGTETPKTGPLPNPKAVNPSSP
ncbi:MAG: hypothetical protein SFU98_08325 [Leptospiraceae bacterium]|nr:hypothetical protein [Leptospiraceae bacterium]